MSLDRHPIGADVREAMDTARQGWQGWREQRRTDLRLKPPRMLLLWIATAPLVPAAFVSLIAGRLDAFIADAAAFALFASAAVLAKRGYLSSATKPRRRFSQSVQLPLLNLGGVLVALAAAITAIAGAGYSVAIGMAFALIAAIGFYLAYGMQPWLVGERLAAANRESRLVAEALAEAENRLILIEQAAGALGNHELRARLGRIAALGREILAQIAARPKDLSRARRFLTVFLEGAEQVSNGYVRAHHHSDSEALEQRFRAVLITIEEQFAHQRQRLTQADATELDIQIEVLQKQLEQEAIR
jgi:5-bromo-4-chloroindolyl phosphate hydrolysis protein